MIPSEWLQICDEESFSTLSESGYETYYTILVCSTYPPFTALILRSSGCIASRPGRTLNSKQLTSASKKLPFADSTNAKTSLPDRQKAPSFGRFLGHLSGTLSRGDQQLTGMHI
jgi:hypothetical protein